VIRRNRKNKREKAFTIIELLTVMSIIIILIGLLVPALNKVQQFAKEVRQNAQFHSIDVAIELFDKQNDGYPPSEDVDIDGEEYCGAMKLAEAMVGQDLLGFHPDSIFKNDLKDADNDFLYLDAANPGWETKPEGEKDQNLRARKGPYLQLEQANATRMKDIYGTGNCAPFEEERFVLCDVFEQRGPTGEKHGMPILYYKANPSGTIHPNEDNNYGEDKEGRIYRYEDNDDLVQLAPWDPAVSQHPMDSTNSDARCGANEAFYWQINNDDITLEAGRPYRSDSYILLSAGNDGLYGTRDDIYNFPK